MSRRGFVVLAGVVLVGIVVAGIVLSEFGSRGESSASPPDASPASPHYHPGFGHPFEFAEVADDIKASDGTVHPGRMSQVVYDALSVTFADVLPLGNRSIAVSPHYPEGRARDLLVAVGQWSSKLRDTPSTVLQQVALVDPKGEERGLYRQRRVDVRYWTESSKELKWQGRVYLEVVVEVATDRGAVERIQDPVVIAALADDFVVRLRKVLSK